MMYSTICDSRCSSSFGFTVFEFTSRSRRRMKSNHRLSRQSRLAGRKCVESRDHPDACNFRATAGARLSPLKEAILLDAVDVSLAPLFAPRRTASCMNTGLRYSEAVKRCFWAPLGPFRYSVVVISPEGPRLQPWLVRIMRRRKVMGGRNSRVTAWQQQVGPTYFNLSEARAPRLWLETRARCLSRGVLI